MYQGFAFQFNLLAGFRPIRGAITTVLPTRVVKSPDEVAWIIDEGDVVGDQFDQINLQGQIVRVNPDLPNAGIEVR